MKPGLALALGLLVCAGCATTGVVPDDQATSTFPSPPDASTPTGPGLVEPVTGGAPVMAIDLGGGMYMPVTGGIPVVGMPLTP